MTAEEFQLKGQAGRLDKILTDLMPGESRSNYSKDYQRRPCKGRWAPSKSQL